MARSEGEIKVFYKEEDVRCKIDALTEAGVGRRLAGDGDNEGGYLGPVSGPIRKKRK